MKHKKNKVHSQEINGFQSVKTDPQGSYTGVPAVPDETPVQDADDL